MPFFSVLGFLKGKIGTLFLSGLFVATASFFVLTVSAPRFKTTADFLVVQTNTQNQDYYTQFKSSEYLGKVFSEALYSERFINAVIETGKVNKEFLPFDKQDRLNTWHKMVSVNSNAELGMLQISVKNDSQSQSGKIMEGVESVLIEKNSLFRGGDDKSVEVRVLSGPITERNPNMKEILFVIIMGFLAGAFVAGFLSLMRQGFLSGQKSFSIPRDMLSRSA